MVHSITLPQHLASDSLVLYTFSQIRRKDPSPPEFQVPSLPSHCRLRRLFLLEGEEEEDGSDGVAAIFFFTLKH